MANEAQKLDRRWVVKTLLSDRRDLLVVTGPGAPAYDTAALEDHPCNFYLWNALGSSAMVGLGLALAQPSLPVVVITGDGDMLMGMGGLATIAVQKPTNLAIVVLDNERYGETGMQESHSAFGVDLAAIASDCGFPMSSTLTEKSEVTSLATKLHANEGPLFANIKVKAEDLSRVLPPRDGTFLRSRFRSAILGEDT
ncbi:MAG: aldehyde dehydrogenase [Rhodospirillaceae bacterium]|nr:aldehyde dehydrogenase [Rhodospirillaceae bacterium]